jgi:hypothetical protein
MALQPEVRKQTTFERLLKEGRQKVVQAQRDAQFDPQSPAARAGEGIIEHAWAEAEARLKRSRTSFGRPDPKNVRAAL